MRVRDDRGRRGAGPGSQLRGYLGGMPGMGLPCIPTATRREVQDRLVTGRGARGDVRWWSWCAWARAGGSTATLDQSKRSATIVRCRPCLRREVLMHGSELHRLGSRGAGPGEFARAGRMESGGRSERGPHPWCKAGPWVRVRRWPKRVACTMRAHHGACGGGRCARSVKSWFGRIESIHWRSRGTHANSGSCAAWRTVCNENICGGVGGW